MPTRRSPAANEIKLAPFPLTPENWRGYDGGARGQNERFRMRFTNGSSRQCLVCAQVLQPVHPPALHRQDRAMALSVNLAQINSAARGNSDLRETLTGIHLALQSLYAQTGTTPLTKVDTSAAAFTAPPGAFAAGGERSQWELQRLHHHQRAECDQRAHLPGNIQLAQWPTLFPESRFIPSAPTPAMFCLTPARRSTGGCGRVITSKTGAAISFSRARSAPA